MVHGQWSDRYLLYHFFSCSLLRPAQSNSPIFVFMAKRAPCQMLRWFCCLLAAGLPQGAVEKLWPLALPYLPLLGYEEYAAGAESAIRAKAVSR